MTATMTFHLDRLAVPALNRQAAAPRLVTEFDALPARLLAHGVACRSTPHGPHGPVHGSVNTAHRWT